MERYSKEEALTEAAELKSKITNGEAKDYTEAEGLLEKDTESKEKGEKPIKSLEQYLAELQEAGISTLTADEIRSHLLDENGPSEMLITREFNCGIRISRFTEFSNGKLVPRYRTWTTNLLEDRNHPLSQRFGMVDISLD